MGQENLSKKLMESLTKAFYNFKIMLHFLKFAFGFQISKEATEEEVEKRSPSKNIELHKLILCATCKKLKTKSQIKLHKLKCTSD